MAELARIPNIAPGIWLGAGIAGGDTVAIEGAFTSMVAVLEGVGNTAFCTCDFKLLAARLISALVCAVPSGADSFSI